MDLALITYYEAIKPNQTNPNQTINKQQCAIKPNQTQTN